MIAWHGFSNTDALQWARDDYLRTKMTRQTRALEEITALKRGRKDEHGVMILDSHDDEDATGPSNRRANRGRIAAGTAATEEAAATTTAATTRGFTASSACRTARTARETARSSLVAFFFFFVKYFKYIQINVN